MSALLCAAAIPFAPATAAAGVADARLGLLPASPERLTPQALPAPLGQAAGTPLEPAVVRECGPALPGVDAPAGEFTAAWRRSGPGWTGGDGTYSVALPDGRFAWVFGDTFVGGVIGGRRTDRGVFARNSLVIQDGGCLETRFGSVAGQPAGFAEPGVGFYWPNQPFVENNLLHIPFTRLVTVGTAQWDFEHAGETDLLSYDLDTFALRSVRTLPGQVQWGTDTADTGHFSYIFGVANDGATLRLARAPRGQISTADWSFWDGRGWSADAAASAPILRNVSAQMSVVEVDDRWVAVSQGQIWDPGVYARVAERPQGPYGRPQLIASFSAPANGWAYNAVVHPAFGQRGGYLLSSNVNTKHELFLTDPALNQPLFARVDLGATVRHAASRQVRSPRPQRPRPRPARQRQDR